ncbi:hypothetical protein V497_06998 [Pseudogymnoascus sp. VKM F-4516 (FW-969)]|nr:hypothetical protein V490_07901 [Pseudogymnoascus sp. VKM F-3557]KFY55398.1 hypothetical protein V497_06998 [Pseudogymnoascus sp. VKM F-4516 (FW-969)]
MAVAQPKPKPASKASNTQQNKLKAQMHRRSRTGCYTCRLRRKKCDEGNPCCSACKNLGLECNYKRPMWWSNGDSRRFQKDNIKSIIKRKKLSEKAQQSMPPGVDTPPGLSHSLPTSATYSDSIDRTRAGSADSTFSLDFNFDVAPGIAEYGAYNAQMHSSHSQYAPLYSEFAQYDVGVKTEREVLTDDGLTRRESTVSTFSTYPTPQEYHTLQDPSLSSYKGEGEYFDDMYFERRESMPEELTANFFDSPDVLSVPTHPLLPDLEQSDESLLGHFIQNVLPSIFPVLEANVAIPTLSDMVLPKLEMNKSYLHCALNISAQHYKSTSAVQENSDAIDADIMRHRQAGIRELCESIGRNEPTGQILDTTLGMIFLQCAVGRVDEALPDVSWHQHFHAASDLIQKLGLPEQVLSMDAQAAAAPFNMTLMAWIDILGASLVGRSPTFADTYRKKSFASSNLGLRELTGCDDRVMYLISEIACLEGLKSEGMGMTDLCSFVQSLGEHINQTEDGGMSIKTPFDQNGVLDTDQLSLNITAAFRIAARIYLCSLVPGFTPEQDSCRNLVDRLTHVLEFIPAGAHGFDKSMVWVYLMGGAVSTAGSSFRAFFDARVANLGAVTANCGSFGRVACLLREVWAQADAQPEMVVSWRDVMQSKGWDFLLI